MSELALKKRVRRAKLRAAKILKKTGYNVVFSCTEPLALIAFRKTDVRLIRVVLDRITPDDVRVIQEIKAPNIICQKEVWCYTRGGFSIREI